jgi:protein-tyrosine sulfotransferase
MKNPVDSWLINVLKIFYKRLSIFVPFKNRYKISVNENYSPFFIIGSGRSGNTLLRRILNNHSELFIPPETFVLGSVINTFKVYNLVKWEEIVALVFSKFEMHPEFETFGITSLTGLQQDMIQLPVEDRSLDNLLNSFYLFYAKQHGIKKYRWGDKTPLNVFFLNQIAQVFPRAKYIHIIRNPYDSIYSYVDSKIYKTYKDATKRWLNAVVLSRKFGKRRSDYFEIYYENLVSDPENEMMKLCKFLSVDFEKKMIAESEDYLGDVNLRKHHANVLKSINTNSIGKGIKNLDGHDKETIDKILKRNSNKYLSGILEHYNIN